MDPPGIQNQNRAIGVLGQGRAGGEGWLSDASVRQCGVSDCMGTPSLGTPTVTISSDCFSLRGVKNSNDESQNLHGIIVMPIEIFSLRGTLWPGEGFSDHD